MEKVTKLIGLQPASGPSSAEKAIQIAQLQRANRELLAANAASANSGIGASLKKALSFRDDKKKSTFGG